MRADCAVVIKSAGITAVSLVESTSDGMMTVCLPGTLHTRTSVALRPIPDTVTGTGPPPAGAAAGLMVRITGETWTASPLDALPSGLATAKIGRPEIARNAGV